MYVCRVCISKRLMKDIIDNFNNEKYKMEIRNGNDTL